MTDAESIATCPMVHSTADADDIATRTHATTRALRQCIDLQLRFRYDRSSHAAAQIPFNANVKVVSNRHAPTEELAHSWDVFLEHFAKVATRRESRRLGTHYAVSRIMPHDRVRRRYGGFWPCGSSA